MSRPCYYWFTFLQRTLERFPDKLVQDDTYQSNLALVAIRKTIEEIRCGRDGEDKVKLIEMVYFKKSHSVDGASLVLHVSERTAHRWNSEFIYALGMRMGFLDR